jgi:hypothetical protein
MRSAIHRCLAILLVFYICVSSANAQVAREPCGWRIVISPATGHVTLLHPFAGLAGLYWWSLILKAFATDSILGRDGWHIRITSSFRRMED